MTTGRVPKDAKVLFEIGNSRPYEVDFEPYGPFKILWVVTNGEIRRNFLWVTVRKTGIYVAFGGPLPAHTSYHTDGTFHWKVKGQKVHSEARPPLRDIGEPQLIQSATAVISDHVLSGFDLSTFGDEPVDRVVYLDNRVLPDAISYHVWAVPPFRHGAVPLFAHEPAHIHIITHTNPWIQVVIYEQGKRKMSKEAP